MKNYIYFTLFLVILSIFMSCTSKNTFVKPEYRDKKIRNATLLIPPIVCTDIIHNEEIFNEIGISHAKEVYFSLFSDNFKKFLKSKSTFQKVDYLAYQLQSEFENYVLNLNEKEKINIDLPKKQIEFDSSGEVYILFLQDLIVSFSKEQKETSLPVKHYTVTGDTEKEAIFHSLKMYNYYIKLQTKYAIFDNTLCKVVSYGNVTVKEKYFMPKVIENLMEESINKLVKDILENTPFYNN